METPELEQIFADVIRAFLMQVRTSTPARIVSFDSATRRATVQPFPAERDADGNFQPLPQLAGVPVLFPLDGSGMGAVWRPSKDSVVTLLFVQRGLGRWLSSGSEGDPQSDRHHSLKDAVAIPGLFGGTAALTDMPAAGVMQVREGTSGLELGAGATRPAARQDDGVQVSVPANWMAAINAAATAANLITPGTVALPLDSSFIGTITEGSATVRVK